MDVYRVFDEVVTSRYHGFILATLTRTPMIVLDGSNSGKITRTIASFFPSLQLSVLKLSGGSKVVRRFKVSKLLVPTEDEVNSTIVKAEVIRDYILSTILR